MIVICHVVKATATWRGSLKLSWPGMWPGEPGVAVAASSFAATVPTSAISSRLLCSALLFQQGSSLLLSFGFTVSHVILVVAHMDQWRERLFANRELFLENDEEDDFNVNWIVGLGFSVPHGQIPRVVRGSRRGKLPNIDIHRHEMHVRMMSDCFADNPMYGPNFLAAATVCNDPYLTILDKVCAMDDYFLQKNRCAWVFWVVSSSEDHTSFEDVMLRVVCRCYIRILHD